MAFNLKEVIRGGEAHRIIVGGGAGSSGKENRQGYSGGGGR